MVERGDIYMSVVASSKQDRIFDVFNYCILTIVLLLVLYPLYFISIASISNPDLVNTGKVLLLPKDISFIGYERILNNTRLWLSYRNTILYTVLGTSINLSLTLPAAYALSRKNLDGRNILMALLVFTMLFGGGLIPTYLLVRSLNMVNTIWAMVIPNAVGVWNVIIARTFFQTTIPDELLDAAVVDGCSNTRFFIQIVLPLSKAIIGVLALFYGVGHWNSFFNALIYLRDFKLFPLQIVLRDILVSAQLQSDMMVDAETLAEQLRTADTIKYGVIIVSTLPILMFYPFIQRYFVKGVMIGSIKG